MSRAGQFSLFLLVAFVAGGAGFFLSTPNRTGPADATGILASTLPDLSGTPQTLANWRGKVLVINFWATWCPPCLEEIPHFVRLQQRLGKRGLQFVGIAVDDRDRVAAFVRQYQINYPILIGQLNAIELSEMAGNKRGGLPYTLVLDRSGDVVEQYYGGLDETLLEPIIKELL